MKILNLFAGLGGNRTLWGNKHQITAVEINEEVGKIYKQKFSNDILIIGDAYQYLEEYYNDFDFIWASPPCTSHTKFRFSNPIKIIPDMRLYGIIIFLQTWFKGKWVVENVKPYYKPLIPPVAEIERHYFWCNFFLKSIKQKTAEIRTEGNIKWVCDMKGLDYNEFEKYKISDKRKNIRNMVKPKTGKYILNSIKNRKQLTII